MERVYGITGNAGKELLWEPVVRLVKWMEAEDIPYRLHESVADGLIERNRLDARTCRSKAVEDLAQSANVILSFGGDGTLLQSARELHGKETPLLGVNIGRLGFLADAHAEKVIDAVKNIEAGSFRVESRAMLETTVEKTSKPLLALNDVFISGYGKTHMISVVVHVDDVYLNTYWADGVIIATATGSTAYSMSAGGPIVSPSADVVLITPVAPHTLTVRPIVVPGSARIRAEVQQANDKYAITVDGRQEVFEKTELDINVCVSDKTVRLLKLEGQEHFDTLRQKLNWGAGRKA